MTDTNAAALARRKWETLTTAERSAHIAKMVGARQKQRKLNRRKIILAQVNP